MAEELIGHIVCGEHVRPSKPEYRYRFVACECNLTCGCVLASKEEPKTRVLTCSYRAFYENPLIRVKIEAVKSEQGDDYRITRILGVYARFSTLQVSDVCDVLKNTARADPKYARYVEMSYKQVAGALSREKKTAKMSSLKLSESVQNNPLYGILNRISTGFESGKNAQDTVNCCVLFGYDSALTIAGSIMDELIRTSVQSLVQSSFRTFRPILRPDMIGAIFDCPEEMVTEAQAAAVIRDETNYFLAVPRVQLDASRVPDSIINTLLEQELIGENAQGIFRASDESLMQAMGACIEHQGECPTYLPEFVRMCSTERKIATKWRRNPIALSRYEVREAHVFFQQGYVCVEWYGEKRALDDASALTTEQIFDVFFKHSSTHRFKTLEAVHVHAAGVSERVVAEQVKRINKYWNAYEVHVWESLTCDCEDASRPRFESCCGTPDLLHPDTIVCRGHIQPAPIGLGKHSFGRAFEDFFANESWCLTARMELGYVRKKERQVSAEIEWNEQGQVVKKRVLETHKDALPLLSLPLLHSYTLPNNFFKNKRGAWVSSEPISPFVWREHQRLFHYE